MAHSMHDHSMHDHSMHDHSQHMMMGHDHDAHAGHTMSQETSTMSSVTQMASTMAPKAAATGHNHGSGGHMHMDMHMTFWFGYDLGDFLFDGIIVNSVGKLVATCFIMLSLGIFYELLKVQNARTKLLALRAKQCQQVSSTTSTTPLVGQSGPSSNGLPTVVTKKTAAVALLKNAAFFMVQTSLGYFLMLAVMMYNAYIFMSVIGGMFIGHMLFGHYTMRYNVESVRAMQREIAGSTKSCPSEVSTTSTLQSISGVPQASYGSNSGISASTTVA